MLTAILLKNKSVSLKSGKQTGDGTVLLTLYNRYLLKRGCCCVTQCMPPPITASISPFTGIISLSGYISPRILNASASITSSYLTQGSFDGFIYMWLATLPTIIEKFRHLFSSYSSKKVVRIQPYWKHFPRPLYKVSVLLLAIGIIFSHQIFFKIRETRNELPKHNC